MTNLRLLLITFLTISCHQHGNNTSIKTEKEIQQSISEATKNTKAFSGRFIKQEKINSRDYCLYLKNEQDSIVTFISPPFFGDAEIKLLKKSGNNVNLRYQDYYNPVKKTNEKIVRYMEPLYGK